MKIIIDAQHLRAALARSITEKSQGMPVLEHVLIRAGDEVEILSTDTQMALTVRVEADIREDGAVCGHAAMLRAALNGLKGAVELVSTIDTSGLAGVSSLVLRAGRRRFRVPSLPADDFPTPEHLAAEPLEADLEGLLAALQAVTYAAAKNDARYYLNGVYIGDGAVVATDGHRLAVFPVCTGLGEGEGLIVPAHAIKPVSNLLAEGARLSLLKRDGAVVGLQATTDGTQLSVHLIEGRYPDWQRVATPIEKATWRAELNPTETKGVLARLMPFAETVAAGGGGSANGLEVLRDDAGLKFIARADDECFDYVACAPEGEPAPLCLDGRYLRDVINIAGSKPVTWHGAGDNHVQAFTIDGRTDTHYIMPMRR